MESNSLRIGNKVLLNGNTGTVTGIPNGAGAFSDVMIEVDYYGVQNNDERKDILEPVLLTDEILLKIGFQISRTINDDAADYFNNATEWIKGDCIILNQGDLYYYVLREINYDIGISYSTKEIKFLHKLQNLYYELEDKEFEIK